ncbi:MAG: type III secretion T3S chaperone [Parachlamydiaceae bacterium]|nr:type III secretion T3S chaperone [Parachlamydiaceae bacterium]
MAKQEYPLKQILEIKKKRVEVAEKVVTEKRQALEVEQDKLKKAEEARDKVKQHQMAKLTQLRNELDHGTTSPKVQQMKAYLKVVDEKLKLEEKKVKDQQARVEVAEKDLEEAKQQLFLRRQEVDKVETHQIDWKKERRKEQDILDEREMDELGNLTYGARRKKMESL